MAGGKRIPISHTPFKKKTENPNRIPLGNNKIIFNKPITNRTPIINHKPIQETNKKNNKKEVDRTTVLLSATPAAHQLRFWLQSFQSANRLKLSPMEKDAFQGTCMVELSQGVDQDVTNLSKHVKAMFGTSWNQVLCAGRLSETIQAGSPAIIVISTSALRSLELLRGLKPFTAECRPVKLFSKHMKVEEQVTLLKTRVNIVSGTPSRIKKLIDMDALLLSRLAVVVLDMHQDAKGYSLLTLPQVSTEFWDLYKSHFHQRLLQSDTRICFYGPIPNVEIKKATEIDEQ